MVNRVILVGNTGRDPEAFTFQNGGKVVSFSLATSESWHDQAGERQTKTEWHEVKVFNEHLADIAEQYVRKGSKLYLEGQIETRKFTDKEGVNREAKEIVLRFNAALTMLDSKPSPDRPTEQPAQQRQAKPEPRGRR